MKKERNAVVFTVHEFMTELSLTPSEILIYALIHSFTTRTEIGIYYGTKKRIAEILRISPKTVSRAYKRFFELGYIKKVEISEYSGVCALIFEDSAIGDELFAAAAITEEAEIGTKTAFKSAEIGTETAFEATEIATESAEIGTEIAFEATEIAAEIATKTAFKADEIAAETAFEATEIGAKTAFEPAPVPPCEESAGRARLAEIRKKAEERMRRLRERSAPPRIAGEPKYVLHAYGREKFIHLTPAQYEALSRLVEPEVLDGYFCRMEKMLWDGRNSNVPAPHSHYRTLKKWIESDLGS